MLNAHVLPILVNVLSYVAIMIILTGFLGKKENVRPVMLILFAPVYAAALFLLNSFQIIWVNSLSACVLFIITALLFFKANLVNSFILSVTFVVIGVASEMIVILLMSMFSETRMIDLTDLSGVSNTWVMQSVNWYNLSGLIGAPFLIFIVMGLVKIFPYKFSCFVKKQDLLPAIFPVFVLYFTFYTHHMTAELKISMIENVIRLILMIGMLSSSVLVFFIYAKSIKNYFVKEENQLLQNQMGYYKYQFELIKISQADISRIEHDIEKHLLALKLDLNNAMPLEAEQKIDLLIGSLRHAEKVADSGNADIDAILNYKAKQAAEFGIRMVCKLRLPYTLHMNTTDLSVILGNAIDNSIEACKAEEMKPPERVINITISYEKSNLHMTFSNPYTGNVKTDAAGEIVTTKLGGNHGLGLKSIRDTVEKYDGLMDITTEGKRFVLKILLFNLQSQ